MKYAHAIIASQLPGWLAGSVCLPACPEPEDGHSLSYGNVTANTRFDGEIGVDNDAGCSLIVVASGGQGRKLSSKNSTDDHPRQGNEIRGSHLQVRTEAMCD